MSKFIVLLIIFSVIFGVFGFFGINVYNQFYGVPADSPKGKYIFVVKQGDTLRTIADKLEEDKVIYNSSALQLHAKLNSFSVLQKGEYELNLNNSKPSEILTQIEEQSANIAAENAQNTKPSVSVTIKEGDTLQQTISKIALAGVAKKEDLEKYAKNYKNFDREKFVFLPEPLNCKYGDINNCAKYYPEGYLYPDTYSFFKPSTPDQIFEKMLKNFQVKVWSVVQTKVNKSEFHKMIIMASVIEKETGRPRDGVNAKNLAEVNKERKTMAGVFFNRLKQNMKWQSDPTGSYAAGKPFCQQTLKIEGCLFIDSPEAQTKYNTYNVVGYPIGPITSPQLDNILAVIEPINSDNLFFVSDATGKKYFAKTNQEHEANINLVQNLNKKLGY